MNKAKLLERLNAGYALTEQALADLSDAEKTRPGTPERWAPKDILAHITEWEKRWLESFRKYGLENAPGAPARPGEDEANAQIFAENQARAWDDVAAESRRVFQQALAVTAALSEADVTDPQRFAWLRGRPFWRAICGTFYWHVEGHLFQMHIDRHAADRAVQIAEAFAAQIGADEPAVERGLALYNLACSYSLAGKAEQAIAALKTAFALNPDLVEWSKQDTDLNPLRDQPAFQAVYAK
jgi:tetratricopeptide (TPR) repeat protein